MAGALFDLQFDTSWGYEKKLFLDNEHRYTKIHRLLRDYVGNLDGKRIVDLGSCRGQFLTRLERYRDIQLEGLEIVEDEARIARERGFESRSHHINAFRGNAMVADLPYEGGSIDVLVAGEIIEHIVDTRGFLAEILRSLAPGGVAVVSTPNLAWWKYRIQLLRGRSPGCLEHEKLWDEDFGHVRIFTATALAELMTEVGFADVGTYGKRLGPIATLYRAPSAVASVLDRLADRLPNLSDDVIALGRRPTA